MSKYELKNLGDPPSPSLTETLEKWLPLITAHLDKILECCERSFPSSNEPDWGASRAFRWRRCQTGAWELQWVQRPSFIGLSELQQVDEQKTAILNNTRQFVLGLPANNVLLTGARGTGKSSLIKACWAECAKQGLCLIEVNKQDLSALPELMDLLVDRPERFILFCDDLSFSEGEIGYKEMKSILEGSIFDVPSNMLVYVSSNRRHLIPEFFSENAAARGREDGEVLPHESVEEKISLSERFGLWVSFYPFSQEKFLAIVAHWLEYFGVSQEQILQIRPEALRFARERGSRSGRVAQQFARHWSGLHRLSDDGQGLMAAGSQT